MSRGKKGEGKETVVPAEERKMGNCYNWKLEGEAHPWGLP